MTKSSRYSSAIRTGPNLLSEASGRINGIPCSMGLRTKASTRVYPCSPIPSRRLGFSVPSRNHGRTRIVTASRPDQETPPLLILSRPNLSKWWSRPPTPQCFPILCVYEFTRVVVIFEVISSQQSAIIRYYSGVRRVLNKSHAF